MKMTQKELIKVLTFISNAYPQKFNFPCEDEKDSKALINTWGTFVKDYDYKMVQIAVKKLIINKPEWPPTVGELVGEIENIQTPKEDKLSAGEAWELVLKAIRRHGVLYGTERAESELPRKVLKTVNCIGGLKNIGMSNENDTYFMNQFCKMYNDVSQAIDMDERLPGSIKKETEMLAEKFKKPQIEGGKE